MIDCFIDHVFISDILLQFIKRLDVLNSEVNLSDHGALYATFDFKLNKNSALPPPIDRLKKVIPSTQGVGISLGPKSITRPLRKC